MLSGVTVETTESQDGAVYVDVNSHDDGVVVGLEPKDDRDTFRCHQVDTVIASSEAQEEDRGRPKPASTHRASSSGKVLTGSAWCCLVCCALERSATGPPGRA